VFGVDPIWKGATNELLFYNSMKMKMSIIIGVIQMSMGLIFHLLNSWYFRKWLDLFFEFLPRILFLHSIFGYLVFLILYKWNKDYIGQDKINKALNITDPRGDTAGTAQSQNLLNELIFMFIPGGPKDNPVFPGQYNFQYFLLAMAFLCIPAMVFLKPCILKYQYKQKLRRTAYSVLGNDPENPVVHHVDSEVEEPKEKIVTPGHGHSEEEFNFSEIMVHQVLESIEFILGSVSHTASYLRLWALSLAHSELATVFWDKVFMNLDPMPFGLTVGLSMGGATGMIVNGFMFFIVFTGWFAATLLVLLFMESLSAFLHALRLHWVEFQSKFYKGDGYPFTPLSWKALMDEEDPNAVKDER